MKDNDINMEYKPFISVIIPFYNVGEYARICLDSLQSQKYYNCEFICIDDGSTDNTPGILEEYEDDKRFIIIHKKNGGLSSARNYGLDYANGNFVTFIDGDDFVHPEYLNLLVESTEGQLECVVISPLRIIKYKKDLDINEGWANSTNHYILDKRTVYEKILYDELSVSACGKLVPRKAYDNIRFPVGKVSEEVATIGWLVKQFNKFSIIDQPLYGYVMRSGSIGHKKCVSYNEIQDRIDALMIFGDTIKQEYNLKNEKSLSLALQYRWGRRLTAMAFMYNRVIDDKESAHRVKALSNTWLKNNIKTIVRNKRAPIAQRFRILMYTYAPGFYCWLFSVYQKVKYNI